MRHRTFAGRIVISFFDGTAVAQVHSMWDVLANYWRELTAFIAAADVVLVFILVPWILSIKKESTSAVAWCLLVTFLPIFGAFLFITFGYQSIYRPLKRKQKHRRNYRQRGGAAPTIEADTHGSVPEQGHEGLAKLASYLSASDPTPGNAVQFYSEGQPAFDAMFDAIRSAKNHIHLEFFIYRIDNLGKKLFDLLGEKARQGVEVRLLIDGVGSHRVYWWHLVDVRKAGVKVSAFLPMRIWRRGHINLRNHRKIVVIDGRVAFTGGLNVGDEYLGLSPEFGHWRDTFLRMEGPAVDALQRVFVEDWDFATGESLRGNRYFPVADRVGEVTAQVIVSGPDLENRPIRELYFAAAMKARKRLWFASPYFVPDQGIRDSLQLSARTGVDVRLLLPKKPDHWLAHFAARYYLDDMMDAGVKVYLYTKGFMHAKVAMVDGAWASVGSANLDNRSLLLNFEDTCLFHTPEVVAALESTFESDLLNSIRLDRQIFRKRPLTSRLAENFCRLFAPVL